MISGRELVEKRDSDSSQKKNEATGESVFAG